MDPDAQALPRCPLPLRMLPACAHTAEAPGSPRASQPGADQGSRSADQTPRPPKPGAGLGDQRILSHRPGELPGELVTPPRSPCPGLGSTSETGRRSEVTLTPARLAGAEPTGSRLLLEAGGGAGPWNLGDPPQPPPPPAGQPRLPWPRGLGRCQSHARLHRLRKKAPALPAHSCHVTCWGTTRNVPPGRHFPRRFPLRPGSGPLRGGRPALRPQRLHAAPHQGGALAARRHPAGVGGQATHSSVRGHRGRPSPPGHGGPAGSEVSGSSHAVPPAPEAPARPGPRPDQTRGLGPGRARSPGPGPRAPPPAPRPQPRGSGTARHPP